MKPTSGPASGLSGSRGGRDDRSGGANGFGADESRGDLGRPIRVVAFFGPFLRSAEEFLCRLDRHPEIELLTALCQADGAGLGARARDLWRRRGPLGLGYLAALGASAALRAALHPGEEIAFRRARARLAGRVELVPDVHAPRVLERVRALAPDLGAIYGGPILRPELFEIPRLGTLGIHHGRLPEYRGKKTTFWEMYRGEETAGVTIQRVNAEIDAGEVVSRAGVRIGRRAYRSVWHEVQRVGIDLYVDAIVRVKRGTARARPPTGPPGRLCRDPRLADILKLWWRQLTGGRR